MSKIEEALALQPRNAIGVRCHVAKLRSELPEEERIALDRVLEPNNAASHSAITRAIQAAYGSDIQRASIARHRVGECRCGRL
jgi:hypothetical protein